MTRNREILSDKEMMRNVLDIVEYLSDSKIQLTMFAGENYVRNKNRSGRLLETYVMNIATPAIKHIDKMSALSHECGHILAKSPISSTSRMINKWLGGCDDGFERTQKRKMYWSAFNIIEDQRIEYYVSYKWRINLLRFKKVRSNLGGDMKDTVSPIEELLAIRFYREDLVKSDRLGIFRDVIYGVEGTGRYGAVKLLIKIKPILDKWFEENRHSDKTTYPYNNIPTSTDPTAEPQTVDDSVDIDENTVDINDSVADILEEDKKEFEKEFEQIQEKMSSLESPKLRRQFKMINREKYSAQINHNTSMAKSLSRFFRKINEMDTDKIDYVGNDVDIETYIENKGLGKDITKSLLNKKRDYGLSILLSIDASSSMLKFNRIGNARELVLSLYKATENVPNVEIQANIWASDANGIVGIDEIKNIGDVGKITIHNSYSLTPTHLALEYSSEQLAKIKGRKKLLIMITDGIPEYRSNQYLIPIGNMIKMCRKSLAYARRKTPNIMCIIIDEQRRYVRGREVNPVEILTSIFGKKRIAYCSDMNKVSERVIKEIQHTITRTLK